MRNIKDKFGSKKAVIKYYGYKALLVFGFYKPYDIKKFGRPCRLVFVCAGNICRSPLAAAAAESLGFAAVSFGLDTRGGDNADRRAVAYGQSKGLDLTQHQTQIAGNYNALPGDLIVAMEPKHIRSYEKLNLETPITLLGLYGKERIPYIHDPYSSNEVYFNKCEERVFQKVSSLVLYLRK